MANLTFSKAFASYGAKPVNVQWAVSAIAGDGSFVMSCWTHYCKSHEGKLRYEDTLSRWTANLAGNNLLREHLQETAAKKLPVRALFARADDQGAVDRGEAVSVKKTFHIREDLVGELVLFDGDRFVIDFARVEK